MSRDRATKTAEEYREMAGRSRRSSEESFERCDTDGYLSQWASDQMARKYDALARLAENGGRAYFRVYLDAEGEPVPARAIQTKYGSRVAVFASWSDCCGHGPVDEWLSWKKADARYGVAYFEAEGSIEMVGNGYNLGMAVKPFRGYDLGTGAFFEIGEDDVVVSDPRPVKVAR